MVLGPVGHLVVAEHLQALEVVLQADRLAQLQDRERELLGAVDLVVVERLAETVEYLLLIFLEDLEGIGDQQLDAVFLGRLLQGLGLADEGQVAHIDLVVAVQLVEDRDQMAGLAQLRNDLGALGPGQIVVAGELLEDVVDHLGLAQLDQDPGRVDAVARVLVALGEVVQIVGDRFLLVLLELVQLLAQQRGNGGVGLGAGQELQPADGVLGADLDQTVDTLLAQADLGLLLDHRDEVVQIALVLPLGQDRRAFGAHGPIPAKILQLFQ